MFEIFKYTNDSTEFYESILKRFRQFEVLDPIQATTKGKYLIQFDETNIRIDAEEICRIESRNCCCVCFVKFNGEKIFLTDYRNLLTKPST